ncbi:putative ribonuclease H protein [Nymphaea thermarum]|nr:putative ribonuclease H protein [Nymphaea thermarum]
MWFSPWKGVVLWALMVSQLPSISTIGVLWALIYYRGDQRSYSEVMHALEALKLSSGLCVNPQKSHAISFGEQRAPSSFINNSDWLQGSLPLPYLGVSLFVGHLCLIRYVLLSLIGYWCSVFMIPKSIQHKLEVFMANFLWGSQEARKGVHLVAWKTLCHPVMEEGVGLKQLDDWNKACIGRITLHIYQDDAPWVNFIRKKYLSFHSLWTLRRNSSIHKEDTSSPQQDSHAIWRVCVDGFYTIMRNFVEDRKDLQVRRGADEGVNRWQHLAAEDAEQELFWRQSQVLRSELVDGLGQLPRAGTSSTEFGFGRAIVRWKGGESQVSRSEPIDGQGQLPRAGTSSTEPGFGRAIARCKGGEEQKFQKQAAGKLVIPADSGVGSGRAWARWNRNDPMMLSVQYHSDWMLEVTAPPV